MSINTVVQSIRNAFDVDNIYDLDFDLGGSGANDFEDSFVVSARWRDTDKELTEEELDILNEDSQYVYESLMNFLY